MFQVNFATGNLTLVREEQIICYFHESDQEGMYAALKFLFFSSLEWGVFFGFGG